MSYVTKGAIWLSAEISQDVKDVLAKYYELADSKDLDAGHLMATRIFTENAILVGPNGTLRGSKEIAKSRDNAWSAVTLRRHTISEGFAAEGEPSELVLLGSVHMEVVNGKSLDCPFAVRVKVESHTGQPRISFMEVFAFTAGVDQSIPPEWSSNCSYTGQMIRLEELRGDKREDAVGMNRIAGIEATESHVRTMKWAPACATETSHLLLHAGPF
ncbi:hypothetical protein CDV31_013511 [Fusarium ambrosium]|uniref:SnoaL-like domain-containing protein n=1 Tax=Fusarium ambrosium TaxID=131363 RepID=A0A428T2R5_9HYPO|nr:hypothetical protein CDV31_013511 [Fusarium ambrosium]